MSIFNICLTIMQYGTLKLIVTSYYSLRKISRYSKTAVCSVHCECVQTWINVVSLTDLKLNSSVLFCLLPLQALSSHQDLDNAARSNKILVLCVRGVWAGERRGENESGEWFCIDTIGRHFIWAVNIDSSVPGAGRLGGAGAGVNCIASTLSASGRSHSDRDGNKISRKFSH